MDNFTYNYLNIGSALSNRLGHVSDAVNASVNTDDIESQNANNYTYDQLGQLICDQQEMIASIEWRSGDKKIKKLTHTTTAGNKSDMEFVYNPLGQRIVKIEKTRTANVLNPESSWKYTYYAYDANGQVMATYAVKLSSTVNRATLTEQNIYGASRLGMRNKYIALYENGTVPYTIPAVQQNTLGDVAYEITNYLGNVNVVISDRKIWVTNAFKACNLSRTDYFPFGMEISSRTTNSDNYRFGYTGKEDDKEINGNGNSYDFGNRQYDPRIGRWLSLDPLKAMYPSKSPFCYAGNTPIATKDPDGNYIIFINGFTGGKIATGDKASIPGYLYWSQNGGSDFINAAKEYFGGDLNHIFLDGSHGEYGLSTAAERYEIGKNMGLQMAEEIKVALKNCPNETIKIITHSMGAAYGEGLIAGLIQGGTDPNLIEKVVHLSAADARDITICEASKQIKRIQLNVDQDYTLFEASPNDCSIAEKMAKADLFAEGKERMIPGVDIYGEINANGNSMLKKDYIKDPQKRNESQDKYDYHAYTKWNPNTFKALRQMEHSYVFKIGKNQFDVKFSCKSFNFNFLKRGKENCFLENTDPSGSGDTFKCD